MDNLEEVFGGPLSYRWVLPLPNSNKPKEIVVVYDYFYD